MYLFEDQEYKEISLKCKLCFEELTFKISAEEYKSIEEFPFEKEFVHGNPPHKLIVSINKMLEVNNFKIEQMGKETSIDKKEMTNEVLREIGLTSEEIDLYFEVTGRDTVSLGEISILLDKPKEDCKEIADKFLEKGLFIRSKGTTPNFKALPPYAALIHQLKVFDRYITEIKEEVPPQLKNSFSKLESQAEGIRELKEYTSFMSNLKNNLVSKLSNQKERVNSIINKIEQIREIKSSIYDIESDIKGIMNEQMEDLSSEFNNVGNEISKGIESQIDGLTQDFGIINEKISEMINNQIVDLETQCENIKGKVSKNLDKLHLGVLQETVESVIDKLFSKWVNRVSDSLKSHLEEINSISDKQLTKAKIGLRQRLNRVNEKSKETISETTEKFNNKIRQELEGTIEDTISNINEITESSAKSGKEIKQIFEDISTDLNNSVIKANDKISDISDDVLESFDNLKELFSTKVINTLENVLDDILTQLQVNEVTTNQFWKKAKQSQKIVLKDIWFIRSKEAAEANLKEEILNARAKVLIIAPEIMDIDVKAIKSRPRHVNFRICTHIDENNRFHRKQVHKLSGYTNVSIRQREFKNLWGVNKDYEEVILCVQSEDEGNGSDMAEIAGIGSIIDEHIKMFVPILEDAWLKSSKY